MGNKEREIEGKTDFEYRKIDNGHLSARTMVAVCRYQETDRFRGDVAIQWRCTNSAERASANSLDSLPLRAINRADYR